MRKGVSPSLPRSDGAGRQPQGKPSGETTHCASGPPGPSPSAFCQASQWVLCGSSSPAWVGGTPRQVVHGEQEVCVPRQATAAPEAQGLLPWCGDAAGSCDLCRGPLVMWVPSAVGKPRGLLRKLLSALPAWNTRADDGLNRRRGLRSVPGHTSSPPAVPPQRCPFCRLACYLESQSELRHPLPPGPSSQGAFGGRVVIPCHGH